MSKFSKSLKREGYVRIRVDKEMREVTEEIKLEKNKKHSIEVVVDRIVIKEGITGRLSDSIETALRLGEGTIIVDVMGEEELIFSENHACPICGFSIGELEPRLFSFNSPFGACPTCDGLGTKLEVDLELVIPDWERTLNEGAIAPWEPISSQYYPQLLKSVCDHFDIDMDIPIKDIPKNKMDIILYGSGKEKIHFYYKSEFGNIRDTDILFEGVIQNVSRRYRDSSSEFTRETLEKYMSQSDCKTCKGYRLKKEALAVQVNGLHVSKVTEFSIAESVEFFKQLDLTEKEQQIARLILKEIDNRLEFLVNVGLNYLTLSRAAGTLSGGEAQRIRLATQIGSALTGVLYVLDEPSIGLHQRDNNRLIGTLQHMRDLDNTLIVVEHDEDTMLAADWLIDIGPGAGEYGGEVVASDTPVTL